MINYRGLDNSLRSRSTTPDPLSPDCPMQTSPPASNSSRTSPPGGSAYCPPQPASPTLHQRMKQLGGVATPLAMSSPLAVSSPLRRSNPPTPTQPRRPDFIGVSGDGRPPPPHYYSHYTYEPPRQQSGSPQRRYMSESELIRGTNQIQQQQDNGHGGYPPRTTTMFDNIQELAGSPQHGQYTWRDQSPPQYCGSNSPPANYRFDPRHHQYRSNPTSPTQTCPSQHYCPSSLPPGAGSGQLSSHGGHYYSPQPPHHHHQQPPQHSAVGRRNSGPGYVRPQSPQIRRKNYNPAGGNNGGLVTPPTPTDGSGRPSPAQKRTLSHMRSLDLVDGMEMATRGHHDPAYNPNHHDIQYSGHPGVHAGNVHHDVQFTTSHAGPHHEYQTVHLHHDSQFNTRSPTNSDHRGQQPQEIDRRSAYDMNYEISV